MKDYCSLYYMMKYNSHSFVTYEQGKTKFVVQVLVLMPVTFSLSKRSNFRYVSFQLLQPIFLRFL
jgi:hypothetical protein